MNALKKKGSAKGSVFDMLSQVAEAENSDGSLKLPLADVRPDPNQPREVYDESKLSNLAKSIKKYGVIQPITVRSTGGTPPYEIITGERRWRAAQIAGLAEIPAFVRDDMNDDSETRSVVQLIENSNRADLSDYELAKFIRKLIAESPDPKKHGLKGEIADYLDRPRADVSRLLKMLDPENVPLIEEGLIGSADALSRFASCDADLQTQLLTDARATGEPITSSTVRAAKAALKAAPAAVPEPSTDGGHPDASAAGAAAGVSPAPATDGNAADGAAASHVATHGEAGDGEGTTAGDDLGDASAAGAAPADEFEAGDGGEAGESDADLAGDDGADDDDDDDGDGDAHAHGGGYATSGKDPEHHVGTSGGSGSGAPRAKAVSLHVTGEVVETMLRYLVDKSADKLEVRLPNDLAIAVIENLGGTLPDNPEHYAQTIKDLLDSKIPA